MFHEVPVLKRFIEIRLKYDRRVVREVPVNLELNVKGLVLVLVDGYAAHKHLEIGVGYPAIG